MFTSKSVELKLIKTNVKMMLAHDEIQETV